MLIKTRDYNLIYEYNKDTKLRVIVDFLIVLNMVLLTLIVIKCILAVLTIDVMLLIYLLASWYIVCIKQGDDLDM